MDQHRYHSEQDLARVEKDSVGLKTLNSTPKPPKLPQSLGDGVTTGFHTNTVHTVHAHVEHDWSRVAGTADSCRAAPLTPRVSRRQVRGMARPLMDGDAVVPCTVKPP